MIRRDEDILRLDLRDPQASEQEQLSLADLEAVRLVLRGGSPIDWHRLNFQTLSEVDDLLRANLLDPDDRRDKARMEYLHREAIRYLKRNFAFRFPPEVEHPEDVRHLLLYASEQGRFNRVQILSCVALKTMHTINHLEARELLLETSVSEAELIQIVESQVLKRATQLTDEGLPVVHFYGSRKSRDSMINKLLSKKASRASDILDKLRFRIVTETRDDIVQVLSYLLRHVFPWNQVTAGESTNNLLNFHRFLDQNDPLRRYLGALQVDIGMEQAEAFESENENEFSGSSYKMINFIVDVPVRLDHLLSRAGDPWMLQKGSIAYVGCEFQVVDQETAYLNEKGENSHARYKARQQEKVSERLMWGLLKERRRRGDSRPPRAASLARRPRAVSPMEIAHGIADTNPRIAKPGTRREPRPPRPALPPVVALEERTTVSQPPPRLRDEQVAMSLDEDSMLEPFRMSGSNASEAEGSGG
ncbi:MAG: TIGR04552 family protein [Proteobacteria bacterium]|nr:TIGR04552 family protein [Pseudomonadota bacterium]